MSQTVSVDAVALLPEIVLAATAGVVLLVDISTPRFDKAKNVMALFGVVAAIGCLFIAQSNGVRSTLDATFVLDHFAVMSKVVLLGAVALTLCMNTPKFHPGEYLALVLMATVGMSAIASSRDLVTLIVSVETLAICTYLLVGWNDRSRFRAEGTLKYFLFGIVSTAVTLYGASLLFGIAGDTSFSAISQAIEAGSLSGLVVPAVVLTLAGIAFKVALVPFHFWAPDAYQAAPVPVTVFLATASKIAGVLALVSCCAFAFPGAHEVWQPVLVVFAIASVLIGNLVALRQTDLIRMLAWSSVGHGGFMVVPIAVVRDQITDAAVGTLLTYAAFYVLGTVCAFGAVQTLTRHRSGGFPTEALHGVFRTHILPGVALAIGLLSLAGIPPLGGWYAKFAILENVVGVGGSLAWVMAAVVVAMTAVGLAYYALAIARMWRNEPDPALAADHRDIDASSAPSRHGFLIVMGFLVVVAGLVPGLIASVGGGQFFGV